ncbi:MAG: GNAT family N-acetyltransferase [Candidatus Dormibacteraceae bacterium]
MARTPGAVLEATACVVEGGWGTYRQFHVIFNFYAANRRCRMFVARDRQERVVATSVATRYANTGWIGHVFVRPDVRGHGLGTRMTSVALDVLQRAGCDTILLAATDLGRPIYERMGFDVESHYHEMRGAALPRTAGLAPYRPLLPSDRAALAALDRQVTGDDRGPILKRLQDFAWGVSRNARLGGAAVPLPWGGAWAALLPGADEAEATAFVRLLRTVGSVGPEVILYPPDENRQALDLLRDNGFEELRTVPRMVLGKRSEWQPAAIWNPMTLGLG